MSWLLTTVLSWLSGGVLSEIRRTITARQDAGVAHEQIKGEITKAEIDAVLESRRILADERIEAAKEAVKLQAIERGWWGTRWIRPAFVYPFIGYWWLVLADHAFVLGWQIEPLREPFDMIGFAIVGSYFVSRPLEKFGRSWIAKR